MTDDVNATAAVIASVLHVPIGTIHRWASEDQWRRIPGRPTRYSYTDASASYTRRRAAA